MSSVQDLIECKQCGYKEADYLYHCRIGEDMTSCQRCGYHESWTAKRNQEGLPCGWTHEIDEGFGVLFYSPTERGAFTSSCLRSAQELTEAERWLRERLAEGQVDPHNSYLTRWNRETKRIEFVIGEFCEWSEAVAQDASGGQIEEVPHIA